MTGISWMHLHICPCNAAQTFISAFASFVLAGAVASSTLATLQFVSHPKTWVEGERHVLVWRKRYAVPLIIFPVVALGTLIGVTLRLDAVHPSNNSMTCEATNPVWVRFLGYAGAPLLLCLPSFGATVYCMVRVYKTHQHIRRSRTRYPDSGAPQRHDVFTAPPSRTRNRTRARGLPIEGGTDVGTDNEIEHMSSSNTLTTASARRFHFPFGHASRTDVNGGKDGLKDGSRNSSRISMPRDVVSSDSTDSDAFPTFAPPSNTPSILEVGVGIGVSREGPEGKEGDVTSVGETDVEKDVWRLKDMDASHTDTEIDGAMEMIQWRKGSIEQVSTMNMMGGMEGRMIEDRRSLFHAIPPTKSVHSPATDLPRYTLSANLQHSPAYELDLYPGVCHPRALAAVHTPSHMHGALRVGACAFLWTTAGGPPAAALLVPPSTITPTSRATSAAPASAVTAMIIQCMSSVSSA
ncbi:hypothetical protein EYR40_002689 [Pleurotus pulmonarius]|nr:hypothetical protein EYR40_002689 [Pleurotus pulmonarius]